MKKLVFSIVAFLIILSFYNFTTDNGLRISNQRCEYKTNPVIDELFPRLSWELISSERNQVQTAFQVMVASSTELLEEGKADLWDSKKMISNQTNQVVYAGKPLTARQKCFWKVRSWDKADQPSKWSDAASWEIGLMNNANWKGEWIGFNLNHLGKGNIYHLPPAPYLRKEIEVKKGVKSATLYVSALGLYEFSINGKKIGEDYLTPGWTNYNKRVYYQTFDVTKNLKEGKNALGTILSYGWYAGYVGYALLVKNPDVKNFYGDVPALLAQIEVTYTDGSSETFLSDASWKASQGPILESDILNGETYDARLEMANWNIADFNDADWKNVEIIAKTDRLIQVHPGNPVQITQIIPAKTVTVQKDGNYIFDMGQNFAGVVTLKVKGKAGDKVVLRFGEMLYPDGRLMTDNLRAARVTDTYILKGSSDFEEWTPKFTFHGFQFIEVAGLRQKPELSTITGLVIGSNTPIAGSFECSNPMINQLYSNITWTQRANFIDIPTDCPQRDERLGWTGDAQIYVGTATLNMDVAAFFTKWMEDLNDDQRADGTYPIYAPAPVVRITDTYSPGWMEAGVICLHQVYKSYNDTRIIEKYWSNLTKFMKFYETKAAGKYCYPEASFESISPKGGFGDWLSIGKKTPPDMLATIYWANSASLMAEMAQATGKTEEAKYYNELFVKIKAAFIEHYANADGKLKCNDKAYGNGAGYVDGNLGFSGNTQTAYANAIYMNMLSDEMKKKAGENLFQLVSDNGGKLATGFLGVKQLLPALSETGNTDMAYKLLLNKDYPSWGYEIENGATTIWERWNSFTKKEGFMAGMNSFSHYSFGAVYSWMFENMLGIKNAGIAYNQIVIKPELPKSGFDYAKASNKTIYGTVSSSWRIEASKVTLDVEIPVNTKATVFVPAKTIEEVTEGGNPLDKVADIKVIEAKEGYVIVEVGSGKYKFESKK